MKQTLVNLGSAVFQYITAASTEKANSTDLHLGNDFNSSLVYIILHLPHVTWGHHHPHHRYLQQSPES